MGKGYLIDTNAAIDYLDNKLPDNASELIERNGYHLSVISRMELLAWPNASQDQLLVLNAFIKASQVYSLDESVIISAIDLRKNYRIKLPDAVIAATALVRGFSLLTRNLHDFNKIPGISVINPHTL